MQNNRNLSKREIQPQESLDAQLISNTTKCKMKVSSDIIQPKLDHTINLVNNKMELLQSQAPAERELLGNSADRKLDFGVQILDIGFRVWTLDIRVWTLDIRVS